MRRRVCWAFAAAARRFLVRAAFSPGEILSFIEIALFYSDQFGEIFVVIQPMGQMPNIGEMRSIQLCTKFLNSGLIVHPSEF